MQILLLIISIKIVCIQSLPVEFLLLVKSARTDYSWKKHVSTLVVLHVASCVCCENTLLCKTCLYAVYYQPIVERVKTHFVLFGKVTT